MNFPNGFFNVGKPGFYIIFHTPVLSFGLFAFLSMDFAAISFPKGLFGVSVSFPIEI
jgi:hypothetical protein